MSGSRLEYFLFTRWWSILSVSFPFNPNSKTHRSTWGFINLLLVRISSRIKIEFLRYFKMRVARPVRSQIVAPKKAVAMKKVCIQNKKLIRNHWFYFFFQRCKSKGSWYGFFCHRRIPGNTASRWLKFHKVCDLMLNNSLRSLDSFLR